jgi:hypothetical protein
VAAPCRRLDYHGAGNRTTAQPRIECRRTDGELSERKRTVMETPDRAKIMKRAYELWEDAGMPEGRAEEFYHLAEQLLREEEKSDAPPAPDNL